MTTINNEWLTLSEKRRGVDVQRKFAGLYADVNLNNEVTLCKVKYWERELYPNGDVLRTDLKAYSLEDLEEQIIDEHYKMDAKAVLTTFINSLGYPGIINPARQTLNDLNVLSLDFVSDEALHKKTRTLVEI